jgi:hypothetical protein
LYWAYRDFGFANDTFASFLSGTFHPTVRSASLSELAIDRTEGRVPFFRVSRRTLSSLRRRRISDPPVLICSRGSTFRIHGELSELAAEGFPTKNPTLRSIEQFVASHADGSKIREVGYLSQAYVFFEEEFHKLHGLCVVNPSDETQFLTRTTRLDLESGKWIPDPDYSRRKR